MSVRLCYFILGFRKPRQVERLLAALDHPDDRVILHVNAAAAPEAKHSFASLAAAVPNVELLEPRALSWGHWSFADVQRQAMAFARQRADWDYFINLSETCYPVTSLARIRAVLAGGDPARAERDARAGGDLWPNYVTLDLLGDAEDRMRRWVKRYWIMLDDRDIAIPLWPRKLPPGLDCNWKGSYWAVLHRSFCDWLCDAPESARIMRFLRHAKHASEFWVPWCLMNSPFRDSRRPGLHYIRWPVRSAHPETLTISHLDEIAASAALFARKFDADADPRALEAIDVRCGRSALPLRFAAADHRTEPFLADNDLKVGHAAKPPREPGGEVALNSSK